MRWPAHARIKHVACHWAAQSLIPSCIVTTTKTIRIYESPKSVPWQHNFGMTRTHESRCRYP